MRISYFQTYALGLTLLAAWLSPGRADDTLKIESLQVTTPVPLHLRLKDLDGSWFTFMASSSQRPDAEYQIPRVAQSYYGGAGSGVYYSRGQTVKIADNTFLVAYSVALPEEKWLSIARALRDDIETLGLTRAAAGELDKERLTLETPLLLSLLNTRSLAAMESIMPFDAARLQRLGDALFGLAQERAVEAQRIDDEMHTNHLQQLGLALQQYVMDYDETLPPLENAAVAQRALTPYVKNQSIFAPFGAQVPYQPNRQLSRKKEFQLAPYASWMVIFYEATPHADGKRAVLFLNGRTRRVTDAEWQRLKTASKIP